MDFVARFTGGPQSIAVIASLGQAVRALGAMTTKTRAQRGFLREDPMASTLDDPEAKGAERLRALARRCRDLSDMTMVPEVSNELVSIAAELEREAERAGRR